MQRANPPIWLSKQMYNLLQRNRSQMVFLLKTEEGSTAMASAAKRTLEIVNPSPSNSSNIIPTAPTNYHMGSIRRLKTFSVVNTLFSALEKETQPACRASLQRISPSSALDSSNIVDITPVKRCCILCILDLKLHERRTF